MECFRLFARVLFFMKRRFKPLFLVFILKVRQRAKPRSAVGNVSGYRCVSDCRSRGHEFDPGPVPYFRGD